MPGYTLRLRPAATRLSGALRLLLVAAACSLAARVRNAVREEAFRKGRLRLTREGLRNVYGSDGRLRSTLLLSPVKVGGSGGSGGGAGGGGGGGGAAAVRSRGDEGAKADPPSSSSSNSMTLVDMVEELFEAVLGGGGGKGGNGGAGDGDENDAKKKAGVGGGDVADDLRRGCEAGGLPFRPERETKSEGREFATKKTFQGGRANFIFGSRRRPLLTSSFLSSCRSVFTRVQALACASRCPLLPREGPRRLALRCRGGIGTQIARPGSAAGGND